MAKRLVLKSAICLGCTAVGSIRKILWGMPNVEPDPDKYVTGGCCIPDDPADYTCIRCDWSGVCG